MLRFIFGVYILGIVVSLVVFLVYVPNIPFIDAVIAALAWPWGVYKYFVARGV